MLQTTVVALTPGRAASAGWENGLLHGEDDGGGQRLGQLHSRVGGHAPGLSVRVEEVDLVAQVVNVVATKEGHCTVVVHRVGLTKPR